APERGCQGADSERQTHGARAADYGPWGHARGARGPRRAVIRGAQVNYHHICVAQKSSPHGPNEKRCPNAKCPASSGLQMKGPSRTRDVPADVVERVLQGDCQEQAWW